MSSPGKKRGGIGNFWDAVAPPAEEIEPPAPEPPAAPAAGTPEPEPAVAERTPSRAPSRPRGEERDAPPAPRGRGRPPKGVVKERMTVNLDPRSLQILESLRYQARMRGQRSATFSELLDEAVALLAKHHNLKL